MNIVEMIDRNARKYPHKHGLRQSGGGVTYWDIRKNSEKVAGCLQEWGVKKGDHVAVMSQNTAAFVYAFFGALKAGAAVVPINHKLTAVEAGYILEHSDAKVLLFDGSLSAVATDLETRIRRVAMNSAAEGFEQLEKAVSGISTFDPVTLSDDDPAEILYTSGTTGRPKGCLLSHRGVVMAGITAALLLKMDASDRLLMAMPIWHSSPLNNWFMGACYVGATTVLVREYHPLRFLEAVAGEKCTLYFGAPISYLMPLQMVKDFDRYDLSSMRAWIYGGGPIAPDTVRKLMKAYRSDRFYQVYGMTETGPTGACLPPEDHLEKAGSIGDRGLPGTDLVVMKNDDEEACADQTGEIWLKADSMMAGYYKNPEATEAAFHEGWYRTGDVARVDEEGYYFIVDRLKDMIVTGGENVYSKEVEDAIAAHPDVREAAVIGVPHFEWGETVVALVVTDPQRPIFEDTLKAFLADRLARFKIPRLFRFVDSLPHTPTGKVMKYKLREMLGEEQAAEPAG